MNILDLHEFCIDWQTDRVSKNRLWIDFVARDWYFEEFEKTAKKNGWYVSSMDVLKELG